MDDEDLIVQYTEFLARGMKPPVYIRDRIPEDVRRSLELAIVQDEQATEVFRLDPFGSG